MLYIYIYINIAVQKKNDDHQAFLRFHRSFFDSKFYSHHLICNEIRNIFTRGLRLLDPTVLEFKIIKYIAV